VQSQFELMPTFRHSRALILSRPAVIAILAAAFGLVLATGLLTALSTQNLAMADQRAAQAQRTLGLSLQFLTTLSDASVAARSAILTNELRARTHYDVARGQHRAELAALMREFRDRPDLGPVFFELRRLAEARFAEFDAALDLLHARGSLPALAALDAAETAHPADEIRPLLAVLQRQEFNELMEQTALASGRADTIRAFNLGLLLVAVACAAGVGHWLLTRVRDLEHMVTVCAWTRRVLWQGRWISFEEYLVQRFDVRCTHGICDEAAARMKADAAQMHAPTDLRRTKRVVGLPFAPGHSAAPFA
jgi:CHASE3 domain sensor protein